MDSSRVMVLVMPSTLSMAFVRISPEMVMETNDSPANTLSFTLPSESVLLAVCALISDCTLLICDESGDFIFNGLGVRLNGNGGYLGELLIIYTSPVCVPVRSTALVPDSAFALVVCSE